MQEPDFEELRTDRTLCQESGQRCRYKGFASGVHPNPRFYKYYWWVFWNESPIDGWQFLNKQYCLSTAAAIQLMDSLKERNEPYWIYNDKSPRRDSAMRIDPNLKRWQGVELAPAYDEDPDPPVAQGVLLGHK